MPLNDDNDKPPTSKEEAAAKCVRPPPEKYDPDELPYWSITMTVAWKIWGEIDAVRNEWDDYRNECADWIFVPDATARAKVAGIAMKHISTGKLTRLPGKLARLPKKLRKDLQKGSWHFHPWKPSGWGLVRLKARFKNIPPQVAIDELWQAGGEGRIKATARECKNAKAFDGDRIEIPAHHWPHLKRVDDPLTGKAMLSDDNGRVYRDVQFRRLDVKELWPKAPPLSEEHAETWPSDLALIQLTESAMWSGLFPPPCAYSALEHVEKQPEPEQTRPAEPKRLKPTAWLDDVRKDNPQRKNESHVDYAGRLHVLMQEAHVAKHVAKLWPFSTLLRRLFDK